VSINHLVVVTSHGTKSPQTAEQLRHSTVQNDVVHPSLFIARAPAVDSATLCECVFARLIPRREYLTVTRPLLRLVLIYTVSR